MTLEDLNLSLSGAATVACHTYRLVNLQISGLVSVLYILCVFHVMSVQYSYNLNDQIAVSIRQNLAFDVYKLQD